MPNTAAQYWMRNFAARLPLLIKVRSLVEDNKPRIVRPASQFVFLSPSVPTVNPLVASSNRAWLAATQRLDVSVALFYFAGYGMALDNAKIQLKAGFQHPISAVASR